MEEPPDGIASAELRLIEAYWVQITTKFKTADKGNRLRTIAALKKMAEQPASTFDHEKARAIRDKVGVVRTVLGKMCGIHEMTLYRYENGGLIPHGKTARKYLQWLAENGFNEPE